MIATGSSKIPRIFSIRKEYENYKALLQISETKHTEYRDQQESMNCGVVELVGHAGRESGEEEEEAGGGGGGGGGLAIHGGDERVAQVLVFTAFHAPAKQTTNFMACLFTFTH
jgi:hypothetical protein